MTRTTNIGWKRKYLSTNSDSTAGPSGGSGAALKPQADVVPKRADSSQRTKKPSHGKFRKRDDDKARVESSEKRRLKRIAERHSEYVCYACRQKGHNAQDCPTVPRAEAGPSNGKGETRSGNICYKCGSNKHRLAFCKVPDDPDNPLPFASCFVCNGTGHIAASCPQNPNGVYPKGGCCRLCGLKTHLVKDCTLRQDAKAKRDDVMLGRSAEADLAAGPDEDDFHTLNRRRRQVEDQEEREQRIEKLSASAGQSHPNPLTARRTQPPLRKAKVVSF